MNNYNLIETPGAPVYAWTKGVPMDPNAEQQVKNVASLPFIHKHVAVMPDVHWGMGATVGSVIATKGAIIPAAVGVDIGCGMMAVQTTLTAGRLPDNLAALRSAIEAAVPHGRTHYDPQQDAGAWSEVPDDVAQVWKSRAYRKGVLADGLAELTSKYSRLAKANSVHHLGTLGTGNHFIEICLDEVDHVWVMLHSGSRGIGNAVGTHFIELAKQDMKKWFVNLPDQDLAYLPEGTEHFGEYFKAVSWAQAFALANREVMMARILNVMSDQFPDVRAGQVAVNCHHNYVTTEEHFGSTVFVTRKGAVRAGLGDLGIIPGSMGARSYIVRGKGNPASFSSCSHGAGRVMSRGEAKRRFTLADHAKATLGVECRKDADVIDETPAAYKDIDAVMAAQSDLVDIVHTLRQVVCVKG